MDVAQGVHDALDRDASQRPAAEHDVEVLAREIERLGVADGEADPLAQGGRPVIARARRYDRSSLLAKVTNDEEGTSMYKRIAAFASAATVCATLAPLGAVAPAYGGGAQLPNENASCLGFLASASNPNASGTIAVGARAGVTSTLAHASPSAPGFPGLLSCVDQIP